MHSTIKFFMGVLKPLVQAQTFFYIIGHFVKNAITVYDFMPFVLAKQCTIAADDIMVL